MMTMRKVLVSRVLVYILAGMLLGGALAYAIPATSFRGYLLLVATWPAWVKGSPIPQPPVPSWAFKFG